MREQLHSIELHGTQTVNQYIVNGRILRIDLEERIYGKVYIVIWAESLPD